MVTTEEAHAFSRQILSEQKKTRKTEAFQYCFLLEGETFQLTFGERTRQGLQGPPCIHVETARLCPPLRPLKILSRPRAERSNLAKIVRVLRLGHHEYLNV